MNLEEYMVCMEALKAKGILNEKVAQELYGVTFKKNRDQSGIVEHRGRPRKWTNEVLETWDWNKPILEISREHNLSIATVAALRRRLGKPLIPAPRSVSGRVVVWKKWDWKELDSKLSLTHGISRERVRQIRAELGLPSRSEDRKRQASIQEEQFLAWVAGRNEIDFLEAKRKGFCELSIIRWCRLHKIRRILQPRAVVKHPWQIINWKLPNALITKAWEMPSNNVASRRSEKGYPKAECLNKSNREEMMALFESEKQKAALWRSEHPKPVDGN